MRTSNLALSSTAFSEARKTMDVAGASMTVVGTVHKTAILSLCALATAGWTWYQVFWAGDVAAAPAYFVPGALGAFLVGLVTVSRKDWAFVTAPLYTLLEGFALGGISAFVELQYPGIVAQAVGLTFGTLMALLLAYRSGLVRASGNLVRGVAAATGGIAVVYVVDLVLALFGLRVPFLHESTPIGILISLGIVVVAAFNLVLDFDFIEQEAQQGAPKFMEWYAAFGLMVTLVWLYLEILRLLVKMAAESED